MQVLMIRTSSDFLGSATPAVAESQNGGTWTPIASGVVTTGKYALILHSPRTTTVELDLGTYEVGIGPRAGTPLKDYLRGRVTKRAPGALTALTYR